MSEYKPSRFEVYFRSSSVFVQCLIIVTASLLILSPISTLIGVTTWIMMSVSLTTAFLVWRESNSLSPMEGTNSTATTTDQTIIQKRTYTIKQLHAMKDSILLDNSTSSFQYSVTKVQQPIAASSSSRSSTPMSFTVRNNSANNYHRVSARSASPMIFYTSGEKRGRAASTAAGPRRASEVFTDYDTNLSQSASTSTGAPNTTTDQQQAPAPSPSPSVLPTPNTSGKSPEDLMDYYADDPALLPQGDVMGRIQWIHQNNGRIRMIGRVLSTRDLFFHFNDVELKDGQSLDVGDRVLFEISVYKNLVCAKHIRKIESNRSRSTANIARD